MYARCIIKKKRTSSYETSTLIAAASELLEAKKISHHEFLDSIANMKSKQYSKTPSTANKRIEISDDDDEVDDDTQPSTSQPSNSKRARINLVNACRECSMKESNVIVFPCTHTALCYECWIKKSVKKDKFCIMCNEAVTDAKCFK